MAAQQTAVEQMYANALAQRTDDLFRAQEMVADLSAELERLRAESKPTEPED